MGNFLGEKGTRYAWLNEESQAILNRGYLLRGESVEKAVTRVVEAAAKQYKRKEFDYDYIIGCMKELIEKGWMSLSSPVWANMGTERGLPISCFNVDIDDSVVSVTYKLGEVIMQSKIGGGTSAYFGKLRGRGASITDNGKSSGAVSFMRLFDTVADTISQGGVRRGAFAAYLDIDHPDVKEFLTIKDIGSPIQNVFTGVCVPDYWMKEMIDGDADKREIWAKILESRQQKGLPYIFYSDNVNRNKPQIYKDLGLSINASNLCSEIALPSSALESFVCCLASMNLELYDEWKDTDAVKIATMFLDGVMQDFIDKTGNMDFLGPANAFAKRHRALGLGVMGWHSYLQSIGLPFDSLQALLHNEVIFKKISEKAMETSEMLSTILGAAPIFDECEDHLDVPRRNTTVMAIAPTTSSSAILGQASPGIEPYSSNYYKAGLAKGNFMRKNKYLQKLLESKGLDTEETWRQIMLDGGSVINVEGLTPEEKDVFKTFKEISQSQIIKQAAARQKYIDQSQSLNLNIPPDMPVKEVNRLYIQAWESGVKTLYYQRSQAVSKELLSNIVSCSSCEA